MDYNFSSGPFLTMSFEFDQDHGPTQDPSLTIIHNYCTAIDVYLTEFTFVSSNNSYSVYLQHHTTRGLLLEGNKLTLHINCRLQTRSKGCIFGHICNFRNRAINLFESEDM